jgi:hypothetical protein
MCGEEDTTEGIAVIGLDLAKLEFQVHGIDPRIGGKGGQRHMETPHRQVEEWPHPNTAAAAPQIELANGAPSRQVGFCRSPEL